MDWEKQLKLINKMLYNIILIKCGIGPWKQTPNKKFFGPMVYYRVFDMF